MDKAAIRAFIQFLDTASMEEIRKQQQFILSKIDEIHSAEGKADSNLALRLIDEEILARMNLGQRSS